MSHTASRPCRRFPTQELHTRCFASDLPMAAVRCSVGAGCSEAYNSEMLAEEDSRSVFFFLTLLLTLVLCLYLHECFLSTS